MNKKIAVLVLCFLCFLPLCAFAQTSETDVASGDGEETDYTDYILEDSWSEFFDEQSVSFSDLKGKSFVEICNTLLGMIRQKAMQPLKTAARVSGILILVGIVQILWKESAAKEISFTMQSAVAVAIFLLICRPFLDVLGRVQSDIELCRSFLAQFVPVMGSILAAGGQAGTSAVYIALFSGVLVTVSQLLYRLIAPLIRIFLALSITQGVSGSIRLDGFVKLMSKIVKWGLGALATLFCAFLSFQGVLANAADSLAMRAGKFILSGGIPIVGGAVSDAVGTVYTGLKLVKSAAGAVGIVSLLLLFVPDLLACLAYWLVCKLCSAVALLIGNERSKGVLEGLSESINMTVAILVLYMMMLILSTALVVLLNTGGA